MEDSWNQFGESLTFSYEANSDRKIKNTEKTEKCETRRQTDDQN